MHVKVQSFVLTIVYLNPIGGGGGTEAWGSSLTKYAKLTKRDRGGGGGGSKCQAVAKDRAICQLVVRGNPGYWRNWR